MHMYIYMYTYVYMYVYMYVVMTTALSNANGQQSSNNLWATYTRLTGTDGAPSRIAIVAHQRRKASVAPSHTRSPTLNMQPSEHCPDALGPSEVPRAMPT